MAPRLKAGAVGDDRTRLAWPLRRPAGGRLDEAPRLGDLIGQRLGFRVGRHAELALQNFGAGAILPQCFRTAAGARIGADQRPLAYLRERIEQRQALGGFYCRLVLRRLVLQCGQPLQHAADEIEGTVALAREPFLKRFQINDEIGEEFAAIEVRRGRQLNPVL